MVKGDMSVQTPYRGFNNFAAEFQQTGSLVDFESSVKVTLPFRSLSLLEASYTHKGNSKNFNCNGSFKYNDNPFTGEMSFTNADSIAFNSKVTTPFQGYEKFEIAFTHEGVLQNFKTTVDVTTPIRGYETWAAEMTHESSPATFTTSAKLQTSFMPPMEFTVSHTGDYYSFNSRASAQYGKKNYDGGVIYNNDGRKIEANYKVNIPNYDEFGIGFVHQGHRNDFSTNVNANYGRKAYGTDLVFKNTNRKTEGSFTMILPYREYRTLGAEFSHEGQLSDFTTTGKANIFGKTVSGTQIYRKSGPKIESNSKVETSFPGYEQFELNLNHRNNRAGISTSGTLNTPFKNHDKYSFTFEQTGDLNNFRVNGEVVTPMESVNAEVTHEGSRNNFKSSAEIKLVERNQRWWGEINHNGNMNNFQTTLKVETPMNGFQSNEVSINHRGVLSNFNTQVSYLYDGHRAESGASFNWAQSADHSFDFSLTLTTPLQSFRELNVEASHKRQSDVKTGYLRVSHNGLKKVDVDYNYNTGAAKSLKVSLKEPRAYDLAINFASNGAQFDSDVTFNWNPKQLGNSVRVDFGAKNEQSRSSYEHDVSLTITLPKRTVGSSFNIVKSEGKYASSASLQWNTGNKNKVSYNVEVNHNNRRQQNIVDGKFGVTTPLGEMSSTLSHKVIPGRQYTTEVQITMDETLAIKNELTYDANTYSHSLTLNHPSFKREVILESSATLDNQKYDGSISLQYERESITMNGKIVDESDSYGTKYTTEVALNYPRGEVDVSYSGEVAASDRKVELNSEFKYLKSTDKQYTISSLKAYFDKINREFNAEIVNPIKSFTVKASESLHDKVNGIHRYKTEVFCTQHRYTADMEINAATSSFEVVLANHNNDLFKVYAQYVDLKNMNYDIYHETSGQRTKDVSISLNKQVDGLVKGQIYVRPDILDSVQNMEFSGLDGLSVALGESIDEISAELDAKKSAMRSATIPIANAIEKVSNDLAQMARPVSKTVKKMWKNDDYNMRSTYNSAFEYYEMALDKMYDAMDKLSYYLDMAKGEFQIAMDDWEIEMSRKFEESMMALKQSLQKMKPHIINLRKNMAEYNENMKEWAMAKFDEIRQNPRVQNFIEKATNFNTEDYLEPFRQYKEEVTSTYSKLSNQYGVYFEGVSDVWNNVGRRQEVRDAVKMVKSAIQSVKEAYNKLDIDGNIREMMGTLNTISVEDMYAKASNWLNDYLQLDRNRFTIYQPRRGNVEFEVYIPMRLPDLKNIPKISVDVKKYYNKAASVVKSYTPESDWVFWDTYYKYKPSMKMSDWIPPFSAHASLFGNQHYKTFDHSFVEFAGQCSYLLARDFINDVYSVVVNYDSSSNKKSIVVTSNKRQIEIFADGRMTVDGSRVEMPYVQEQTSIVRKGNMVKIANTNGIDIECDLSHDRCTVYTTGWYYGSTGGLLGTYDNEKYDDLITSDNRITNNVEDFADSWASGRRCRSVNRANVASYNTRGRNYELCANFFKYQDSPFRPCFKQADPEDFMKMCMNELENTNDVVQESDICNVASHYIAECKVYGVPLRAPTMCVTCKFNNGKTYPMGPSVTIKENDIPDSADVVFVVQNSQNNKNVIKNVKDIIDDLDKALKSEGLVKNMYGLVGYGGHMNDPHTHTMDGQIMSTRDQIVAGLAELNFEESEVEGDTMAALMFAANYPFRTGVSKTIILIPSDKCSEKSVRYAHMQQVLLDRDIRVHMLLEHEFNLKGSATKSPKTAYIFGSDKDGVFTHKHVTDDDLISDKDLRRQVALPKDICAALTEDSDGSVFSSQQLTNNKPNMQKKFIDVFVRFVADKAEPASCQICDCMPDEVGAGFASCRSCERRNPIYELFPEFTDFEVEAMEKQMQEQEKEDAEFRLEFDDYLTQQPAKPDKKKKALRQLNLKKLREERRRKNRQ